MRRFAILSVATLCACAGATNQSSTAATARVTGAGGMPTATMNVVNTTTASVTRVEAPIDRVWRLMPGAYDSLKIPLTTLDAGKHFIGNEGMKIRQKLGNVFLSNYIDCGQAQIGPSADSYDVYLNVTTLLRAVSPTETEVATTVDAAAKPLQFAQEYSRCNTKGTIEEAISKIVAARIAK